MAGKFVAVDCHKTPFHHRTALQKSESCRREKVTEATSESSVAPPPKSVKSVMGVLLVAVGLALLFGAFTAFSYWLLDTFPSLGGLG